MSRTLLITAIGSFSADIAIKTAKEMGMRVIGCDIHDKELVVDAYNVDVFYKCPLSSAEKDYMQAIFDIIRKENVTFLLPSTDPEVDVLNRYRQELLEEGVILAISSERTIKICRDKYLLFQYMEQNGIGEVIPTTDVAEFHPETAGYPVVCKPRGGRSSQGMFVADSEAALRAHRMDESYIIQPQIKGDVVTADVVRHPQSKQVAVILRKELIRTLNGAGLSVYVFRDERLECLCRRIAEILDVSGCVNFEFILDGNGRYHFVECNPRFSGGIEFSCIAGYQCVKNHFRCFTDCFIDEETDYRSLYIARKYEEYVTKIEA